MARIEVPMPQMGESIAEGTVSRWLKEVGEPVERDEPILEISTDKVDAEIPAPASGTLVAIEAEEGQTVEVGTVVAWIDTEGGAPSRDGKPGEAAVAPEAPAAAAEQTDAQVQGARAPRVSADGAAEGSDTAEDLLRKRSTPVVRKIAAEHGVNLSDVTGTGQAGRVTKRDILAYIEASSTRADEPETAPVQAPGPSRAGSGTPVGAAAAPSDLWSAFYGQVEHPEFPVREGDTVEPMNKIRRLTAEHMVLAKRVAPHVHSFIEVDFTRVARLRKENRDRWEEQGARVSYTAFVAWACSRVLGEFPQVNATVSGNNLLYRGRINVGIAVDLDPGLIVPVMRDADELSLLGIAKRIVDLAERARDRQLTPDEVQGASFSITNPGVLGTLVGMPIIPKGTAAILGTGAIAKRAVVVEDPATGADAIAVRLRSIFSLGYDHRIVDGADAARFLGRLRGVLESFPEDA